MWFNTDQTKAIDSLMELLADERDRCARAEGALDVAERQLAIAQNNFEWARVRLNQIEAERASLLQALVHVPIQPVAIERPDEPVSAGAGLPNTLGFDFEDIGDDAARHYGIDHEARGAVRN